MIPYFELSSPNVCSTNTRVELKYCQLSLKRAIKYFETRYAESARIIASFASFICPDVIP